MLLLDDIYEFTLISNKVLLLVATKIGIHRRLFSGDNFIYKKFQEIVPGGVTFNTITISHRTTAYNPNPTKLHHRRNSVVFVFSFVLFVFFHFRFWFCFHFHVYVFISVSVFFFVCLLIFLVLILLWHLKATINVYWGIPFFIGRC